MKETLGAAAGLQGEPAPHATHSPAHSFGRAGRKPRNGLKEHSLCSLIPWVHTDGAPTACGCLARLRRGRPARINREASMNSQNIYIFLQSMCGMGVQRRLMRERQTAKGSHTGMRLK